MLLLAALPGLIFAGLSARSVVSAARTAQTTPVPPQPLQNPPPAPPIPAGVLHYRAFWRLLPAGVATLSWSRDNGLRHIAFTADSIGAVSLFFPIRDRMDSNYNPASFCTSQVDNDNIEGRRHRQTLIDYEPARDQLILDETDPATHPPSHKHVVKPIPGCVLDLFSALDYARAQPLRVGDDYHFPVNEGGRTAEVDLKVDLKETVTTPAGTFSTVRAEPTLFDSVFKRPGRMWIWFSDDARHLPVQVKATVSWGTILAQLTN